jgi:hypothetical protein
MYIQQKIAEVAVIFPRRQPLALLEYSGECTDLRCLPEENTHMLREWRIGCDGVIVLPLHLGEGDLLSLSSIAIGTNMYIAPRF